MVSQSLNLKAAHIKAGLDKRDLQYLGNATVPTSRPTTYRGRTID
jgi:hypothetical protein